MTPRKDLVEQSAPFLPEGSEIRHVFICQAAPNFLYFVITYLAGLTMRRIKYRCVAVTPDAIYVLESSKLSGGARPQSLVGTMPRHTQLGPVSGRWAQITILGERHWVHRRFHPSITAADREAGFTTTLDRYGHLYSGDTDSYADRLGNAAESADPAKIRPDELDDDRGAEDSER